MHQIFYCLHKSADPVVLSSERIEFNLIKGK